MNRRESRVLNRGRSVKSLCVRAIRSGHKYQCAKKGGWRQKKSIKFACPTIEKEKDQWGIEKLATICTCVWSPYFTRDEFFLRYAVDQSKKFTAWQITDTILFAYHFSKESYTSKRNNSLGKPGKILFLRLFLSPISLAPKGRELSRRSTHLF